MLFSEEFHLAAADAVLAGAGAFHRNGALDQALVHLFGGENVGFGIRINDDAQVEVAVADVAQHRHHAA